MDRSLNVLLIVHTASERAGTIREHVEALTYSSCHRVVKVDNAVAHRVDFAAFDVIALHFSLVIASSNYIGAPLRDKITSFRGLKVLFIQDEYRWIDATAQAIRDLGIGVVFSLIDPKVVRQVYCHPFLADVRFEHTLTGFVPKQLVTRRVPDYEQRPLDVGYRARRLSAWYGHHTLQKWQIAEAFAADARRFGLAADISTREEDRIYGRRWVKFLANCKAGLGTESGASVLDYTDAIRRNVEAYLVDHPHAQFDELRQRFFSEIDGRVVMNVISPRCFEAAALRTLMVMYPGEYGGILEPWRHYVLLEPDHSNIADVVDIIRSPARARPIIERAYREIACSDEWSLAALGRHFDRVVSEEGRQVRVAGWSPDLVWRARAAGKAASLAARLRMIVAETAMRLDRGLLVAAKNRLPDKVFARFESGTRKLRHTARRLILGV
jgi:hypothetical protein